jgi:3'(2'), 5'-bisphosphate nucleotidase
VTASPRLQPAPGDPSDLGRRFAEIAEAASAVILPFWRAGAAVERKMDDSPVTEADRRAEALILAELAASFPDLPVIAEEMHAEGGCPPDVCERFVLVDPLDGTKGFVRGGEAFTVNIGLIEGGRPVAGAVAAPASGLVWYTDGSGAVRRKFGEAAAQPIRVRERPADSLALVSHSLAESVAERQAARVGCRRWQAMDSSVKFCLIAQGHADAYPRSGRLMEWDTAAGEAVLIAAGGRVLGEDGRPLRYGKPGYEHRGFVAIGG